MNWFLLAALANATNGAVPLQGQLTAADGTPLSGTFPLTVRLLDDTDGDGTPTAFHTENQSVAFFNGAFGLWLGGASGVNLDQFARNDLLWVTVQLPDQPASAPTPIAWAPRAGWAAAAGTVAWSGVTGVPATLLDGDQDTTYSPGAGLALTGTSFSVATDFTLPWSRVTSVPADLANGDQDTTYTPGSGLALNGTSFSVATDYTIPWARVTGVPSDLADGDQANTWVAGAGLTLTGNTLSANTAGIAGGDGTTQAKAAHSCRTLRNSGVTSSNVYWIDPTDGDTTDARQVYCDMVTDGGGWTFLGHVNSDNGGGFFFTNDIGTYSTTRVDTGAMYSIAAFLAPLGQSEAMVTLDTADPPTADTANKLVFYKFPVGNPGFTSGPLPCTGLYGGFMYRINISGAYIAGGTSNSCIGTDWYTRTTGNGAYLVLFHSTGLGHYWGAGMGGNDSWNHDGWWYVR